VSDDLKALRCESHERCSRCDDQIPPDFGPIFCLSRLRALVAERDALREALTRMDRTRRAAAVTCHSLGITEVALALDGAQQDAVLWREKP
jgi:hypothetical protein